MATDDARQRGDGMALTLLLALQAAADPSGGRAVAPVDFDLARAKPGEPVLRRACTGASPGEIVVCGRPPPGGDYPLEEMAKIYESGPLDSEVSLGDGVRGSVTVSSVEMPGGQISKRVMVNVGVKF
jgi:hypothetical protein